MTSSRREFVLRLAKGTVWSVPVVRTLAAPEALRAQGESQTSQKGGMGTGMDGGMMAGALTDPIDGTGLPTAPWTADPP